MDYPKQHLHGYYVRIQRDGKQYAQMFSVSQCGSMEEALAQAISYRDHILERWQQYCGGKDETIQYKTTNSGYPGISISQRHGHPVLEINLRTEDGVQKGKTLSLPPEDSEEFEEKFEEKFAKAKKMVDKYNRKRFGGRWHQYKKRKNLID
ncbi:MAG TPA: hypothetical protein VE868_01740, partial [Balneolaceae bacterium]|nr:hypothetical protein [Balneolaceae bacterium]